jgi:SAM-dependent methyltransferase
MSHATLVREAFESLYRGKPSLFRGCADREEFIRRYESEQLQPYHAGGTPKSYGRRLAIQRLLDRVRESGRAPSETLVIDVGCGRGELSVYLACIGFRVIGLDLSHVACATGEALARPLGVGWRCRFVGASLDHLPFGDNVADYIIGHASLHHFIAFGGAAAELARVMRPGGEGVFCDAFGENPAYRLFHDRAFMRRFGDVVLTRRKVLQFFSGFDVTMEPCDWFVMLDKLYARVLPRSLDPWIRRLSRVHFALDRLLPSRGSLMLFLAGSVVVRVTQRA